MRRLALILCGLLLCAAAPDPADRLPDASQEARARAMFAEVRCVVCQNESIDDSEADMAHDLRQIVREQVAAGRSDDQIRAFLVERYGDFILLRPPVDPVTAILWGAPFAIVVIGVGWIALRRRRQAAGEPLSDEELKALKALRNDADDAGV
jgi:cytochrome c-type biogenesis protein CcmH